ncbi:MAG: hypothetical protein EXX96DRAFT_279765 [Benjaminiella poitrasii]|nr:MAG: hypothetical protein EXX96DRAFT_279765 [Benjaminiella poitrasii]
MKSDNKSINTSDKASQSSNKSSTAKHSNPILQKDKRGIPIVQPTDKITVSSLRQKTKKLNKDIDTSEINDEVQVCKMRSRDNSDTGLRSQSSTSRSRSVAAHYFQSTHLVHSSTRTFSESWQDASTEPLNADSPTLHSQNNPPTENTRKEEFDLHHLNTLNASPSGDTEQPTLSPPAQSTATQSTATQSTAEPQSITTTQSLPDQSAVAQSTAVQSTATQSEEKTSSPQTPESYNLLKRKIMTEDDDIYTTEANKKQRHLTKGSDVQQSEPVHVNSSPKTMLPRPQPKAAPSEENLDASQASNKDNSLKRKTVTDDDDTYTTENNQLTLLLLQMLFRNALD